MLEFGLRQPKREVHLFLLEGGAASRKGKRPCVRGGHGRREAFGGIISKAFDEGTISARARELS